MPPVIAHRRFTVDEYHRMADVGILTEDDQVELLDGEIIPMSPIGTEHAACVNALTRCLYGCLPADVIIQVQNPIGLNDDSEPVPDISVLQPRDDGYRHHRPGPAEVQLVIEVADSSLEKDRQVKIPLYAQHGIREVWLIDLIKPGVEVYRSPGPNGYADMRRFVGDQRVTCQAYAELNETAGKLVGR